MGVYVVYSTIKMRKTGEINTTLLLDKDTNPKKCKDKDAYMAKVMPCLWILGIGAIIYGGLMLFNVYVASIPTISLIGIGIFFIVIVWYAVVTMKAKKEFF